VRFPIIDKVWATTTEDLANRVLKDNTTYTQRREDRGLVGLQWWMPSAIRTLAANMAGMDEPDHRRLRDIVRNAPCPSRSHSGRMAIGNPLLLTIGDDA
jgi:cytochrome P450 PksS